MTTVEVFAPAKINLTLHITGQRGDGYHELDSLVAFAKVGDRIEVKRTRATNLTVSGEFASEVPTGPDNLVVRASRLLEGSFDIHLEKNLPVSSGIGGGSADAAATLRAIGELTNTPLPGPDSQLALGADVPVCVMGGLVRMRGIGERLEPIGTGTFGWPLVLVNPRVSVSTPEVFRQLASKDNSPMDDPYTLGPVHHQQDAFFDWLSHQRNDLEAPALAVAPAIGDVLDALKKQSSCQLARMSGSGATCFGLFVDEEGAHQAAQGLRKDHPKWWVATSTGPGF